jgi:hypothetical protein
MKKSYRLGPIRTTTQRKKTATTNFKEHFSPTAK